MPTDSFNLPVVIFGGGAAGLWLLDELTRCGIDALLLEAAALGTGQTVGSQGIIHGGLKYTLQGLLTSSAQKISDMPLLWRRCLAGQAQPDLSAARLRADFCYLWRTDTLRSRLGMLGARAGLQVAPVKIEPQQCPPVLRDCPGDVFRLDEQVLSPGSFIEALAAPHRARLLKIDARRGLSFTRDSAGVVRAIQLTDTGGQTLELRPRRVVFTAGQGNAALREAVGLPASAMQRRPLQLAVARGDLPPLNGHCTDGAKTRVTITTDHDSAGRTIWQVGGQVSEDGVAMQPRELAAHARREVQAVLPGAQLAGVQWCTYRVDRAEGANAGARPDDIRVLHEGNTITAWPTKLALAPRLASAIRDTISAETAGGAAALDMARLQHWPRPAVALPPWETTEPWFTDL